MTKNKKLMSSNMSEESARDLLLKRGVSAFMRLAGYIVPQLTDKHSRDPFAWHIVGVTTMRYWGKDHSVQYAVRLHSNYCICYDCKWRFEKYLTNDLTQILHTAGICFYSGVRSQPCYFCGEYVDEIPF